MELNKYHFTYQSAILTFGVYICNQALTLGHLHIPDGKFALFSACTVGGGIILDKVLKPNVYDNLFRNCGLVNKENKAPIIIKEQKSDDYTTLVLSLPNGLSQEDFERKQTALEQALNCKIEFGFNKNLIMKCIHLKLSTKYDYEYEDCGEPTEVFIGYTNDGKFYFDIDKATQIIVAGEPNSGKSSLLRTILLSLLISQHNIDIHLIDFQAVELGIFQDCKKVKSYGEKPLDFEKLIDEMAEESERRLKLFASVRNKHYIQKLSVWNKYYPERALPYKIIVVDEFARLAEDEYKPLLEKFRTRVAMDRKVGILYVASMQRPDVKIISGSIKGSMPTRIAFKTVTSTDSEVILDVDGAEKIRNQGRCLMKYLGEFKEVQCLYIEPEDVKKVLKEHKAYKTKEDMRNERQEKIKQFRLNNKNPYQRSLL